MRRSGTKLAAAAFLFAMAATPALARSPAPQGPAERVRTRILDGCVMNAAGTPEAAHPVPKCRCYAAGVVRAMNPDDLRRFLRSRTISDALHDKAERIYDTC